MIYCDKCKETDCLEIRKYKKGRITRTFLRCNNCFAEYDILYEDEYVRNLMGLKKGQFISKEQAQERMAATQEKLKKEWEVS